MNMFAIDTNLLVYAHNKNSQFNEEATAFLEKVMNDRDEKGNLQVCVPAQVLMEFVNAITRQNVENPPFNLTGDQRDSRLFGNRHQNH